MFAPGSSCILWFGSMKFVIGMSILDVHMRGVRSLVPPIVKIIGNSVVEYSFVVCYILHCIR